ncbi:MAG TPA: hypothetical protein VLA89_11925 [Gemmatimonadales bacterium]|nr:hypothetical protein [Gemmatimonadales bacterium]
MIIRIRDAREPGETGSVAWWTRARESAARGRAPHGIHQLLLDQSVTHVDVFATEVSEVWRWAEQFDGWVFNGRKQLKGEPLDSRESRAPHVSDDSLRAFRNSRPD